MAVDATVLVTDDDEDLRLLCCMHLELGGYTVSQAANGRQAIDVARAQRPQLILLDLMMPVMDGWECLAELKADGALRTIPVFIITGKAQKQDQDKAFNMGAEAFIPKPFKGSELIALIREQLAA
jgi:CheY-like chemotaxis protein